MNVFVGSSRDSEAGIALRLPAGSVAAAGGGRRRSLSNRAAGLVLAARRRA
jgi:hypothetical protein